MLYCCSVLGKRLTKTFKLNVEKLSNSFVACSLKHDLLAEEDLA